MTLFSLCLCVSVIGYINFCTLNVCRKLCVIILQINQNYQLLCEVLLLDLYRIGKRIIKWLIWLMNWLIDLEKNTAHKYLEICSMVEQTAVDNGICLTKYCNVYAYAQINIFTIVQGWISINLKLNMLCRLIIILILRNNVKLQWWILN